MPKISLPIRNPNSHKGEFGKVLIVAGSHRYHGAPIYNVMASELSGADLITLYLPSLHAEMAKNYSLNCFINTFVKGDLGLKDIGLIVADSKIHHALLIGCGLGTDLDTKRAILMILAEVTIPVVIDAEALIPEILEVKKKSKWLLTPHKGEFKRVFGVDATQDSVLEMAKKYDVSILLKSPIDIIADKDGVYLNSTGCNQMRVGGTGDALAGICTSFISQSMNTFEAACSAAYYFGKAGEDLANSNKFFTTKMLIKHFPKTLKA